MVPFTWVRCLFFLGSMVLYTTDVVRSGLGIQSLTQYGEEKHGIDAYFSFGPFDYPIQTIHKDSSHDPATFAAIAHDETTSEDTQVDQVEVWPYKYDTLSIGLRALAIELEVEEYPKCLLAVDPPCREDLLSSQESFTMLDGLIDAIQGRLLQGSRYVAFAVEHQWIDSVEQKLYGIVYDPINLRYFGIHSYHQNATHGVTPLELLEICPQRDPHHNRPSFCSSVKWAASFVLANATEVMAQELIALRFARFQSENPELDMEMLIINANNPQWMRKTAAVFYDWEDQEIVVLTRGRKCTLDRRICETVLIDDYRFERITLETNVHEWYSIVASIRLAAQAYAWCRVIMLVMGIVWSTWYEIRHSDGVSTVRFLCMSWVNLMKVPSHIVVYGTMIPVVLYAMAHLVDCYMYHLVVQDKLSTTLGRATLLPFDSAVLYVTLKMRNLWFIALFCIGIVVYDTHYRHHEDWSHRRGVVGFRGSLMSSLSCITLLFPVRYASFRRIDIRAFIRHQTNWHLDELWPLLRPEFAPAETGPFLEIRCLVLAYIAFAMGLLCAKMVCFALKRPMPRIMDQSTVIPYSAGTLWPAIALTGYWRTELNQLPYKQRTVHPSRLEGAVVLDKAGHEIVLRAASHIRALRVETRSEQVWALIRLMNIVMMTNPWDYLRLRYFGVPLYLYRVKRWSPLSKYAPNMNHTMQDPEIAFLLPGLVDRLYEMNQLEHGGRFELVAVVNSRTLSWNELIMCG